jgi:hypothetical protein
VNFNGEFFSTCIAFAQEESTGSPVFPNTTPVGDFHLTKTKDSQSPLTSDSYSGAFSDFYGFPSHPISVYRTGDEWPVPKGPQGAARAEGGQARLQPPDPSRVAHTR